MLIEYIFDMQSPLDVDNFLLYIVI